MRYRCFDCKEFHKGTDEFRESLHQEVLQLQTEINKIKIRLTKNRYETTNQKKQDIESLKTKQSQVLILKAKLTKINELVKRNNALEFERCFVDVAKNILTKEMFKEVHDEAQKLRNQHKEELEIFMAENHFELENNNLNFPVLDNYSRIEVKYLMREPVGIGDKSK